MPDDNNLRQLFAETPDPQIDLGSVLSRSRARRVPRLVGVGALGLLVACTVVVGGVQGLGSLNGTTTTDAGTDTSGTAPRLESQADGDASSANISLAPAEKLNLCTGTVAQVEPSQTGLVLSVSFPASSEIGAASVDGTASIDGTAPIDGTATMTNTGTQTITGSTGASPAITLAKDGIVTWHSNGPIGQVAIGVDLEPGESMDYAVSYSPVVCGVEDDSMGSFRTDLPAASAGTYEVSAAIDFLGEQATELISGPAQTVTLR